MRKKINGLIDFRVCVCQIICMMHSILLAGISIKGELTYLHEASIGSSYQGTILIQNDGDEQKEVLIYQKDYMFYSDGRVLYDDPGSIPRSNADWIHFSPKDTIVSPFGNIMIHYRVDVPQVDTLRGSYWSLLMIEPGETAEKESIDKTQGVKTILRYGVQLITQIGYESSCKIHFMNPVFERIETKNIFRIDLENIGVNMVQSEVWLELYDETGNRVQLFEKEKSRVFPGTSIRATYDLSNIVNGLYRALVIADCGGDNIFGAQYQLKIDDN